MAIKHSIIGFVVASCLISMAYAVPGEATFYTTYVPSSCYGFEPQGTMIAAANSVLFNNRAACGRTCTVTCTGPVNNVPNACRPGSVTVRIVDLCPGCSTNGGLDLSQEAFSVIANPDAGRVRIDYNCN